MTSFEWARTGRPSNRMRPPWMLSRPLMHRSSVDLPVPLGPTMTTTWPGATVRSMPSTTVRVPKRFTRPSIRRIASAPVAVGASAAPLMDKVELPFERRAPARNAVVDREVQRRDDEKHLEADARRLADQEAGLGQLHVTDDRGEGGVLEGPDVHAHGRGQHDANRLRPDDVTQDLAGAHASRPGGVPLTAANAHEARSHDLTHERARHHRQRQSGGGEGREVETRHV